jgi:SnoaL-like domain
VVRGREAVAAHLKDQTSVLGDLMVTIVDVRARDETVVVRSEGTAHGAESGVDVPAEATQVFEVAAGRLQRARMFLTWEEALEAALLSHPALDLGLLRQPSGFEGFGMALVCPTPDAKTVAVAGEPADLRIQGDAAPEPGAKPAEREDGVPEVSNLLDTRFDFLERGVHVRPPSPEALVTVVGVVALDLRRERVPLGLGVPHLQHRLQVTPVVAIDGLTEKRDVFLRHPFAVSRGEGAPLTFQPKRATRLPEANQEWTVCAPNRFGIGENRKPDSRKKTLPKTNGLMPPERTEQ